MSYIGYVIGEHDFKDPLPVLARANHFTMADLEHCRRSATAAELC